MIADKKAVRLSVAVGFLILAGVSRPSAVSAGDKLVNVQGKLTDSLNNPLVGAHTVTFRLYQNISDPVASAVWTESRGVVLDNGAFNVGLGEVTSLDSLAFDKPYYLGIQVAGDSDEMTPRPKLGASGHSLGSVGEFNSKKMVIESGTSASGAVDMLTIKHSSTTTAGDGPALLFRGKYSGNEWLFGRIKAVNSGANYGSDMLFETKPEDGNQGGALTAKMAIKGTGNVGIGTVAPTARLDLIGGNQPILDVMTIAGPADNTNPIFRVFTDWPKTIAPALSVYRSGAVGVGTSNPLARLHIASPNTTAGPALAIRADSYPTYGFDFDHEQVNQGRLDIYSVVNGARTHSMTISRETNMVGHVGIGTISPNNRLTVVASNASDKDLPDTGGQVAATFISNPGSNGRPTVAISRGEGGLGNGNHGPMIAFYLNNDMAGTIWCDPQGNLSYNAFTGSHYGWSSADISSYSLVSMTGINRKTGEGIVTSEPIYGIRPVQMKNDKAVLGTVFSRYSQVEKNDEYLIAAVGNHFVWVVNNGENIEAGDFLISSDVLGHAEKDLGTFPVSYVAARAGERVDWVEVTETTIHNGVSVKHKLLPVFFEFFVKENNKRDVEAIKQKLNMR